MWIHKTELSQSETILIKRQSEGWVEHPHPRTSLEGFACLSLSISLPLDVASLPNGLVNAIVPQLKLQHAESRCNCTHVQRVVACST